MLTILRRAVFPLLLILAGIVAIIYGAAFHAVPVLEDREREETKIVIVDSPPEPPPFPGMDNPNGPPFSPPKFKKVTEKIKYQEATAVSEPDLIRNATIGGIVLTDKRELKLRYSSISGEKPPAMCPT